MQDKKINLWSVSFIWLATVSLLNKQNQRTNLVPLEWCVNDRLRYSVCLTHEHRSLKPPHSSHVISDLESTVSGKTQFPRPFCCLISSSYTDGMLRNITSACSPFTEGCHFHLFFAPEWNLIMQREWRWLTEMIESRTGWIRLLIK